MLGAQVIVAGGALYLRVAARAVTGTGALVRLHGATLSLRCSWPGLLSLGT